MIRQNPFETIYRMCNTGTNLEKYQICLRNVEKYPKYMDIELTNHCNLNCYMCPVGTRVMKRQQGFMSMEIIEKLCDELIRNSYKGGIRLIRWGEPTIHPQFIDILRRLKETGALIHFNTNGIVLTEEMIRDIINLEIDSVKFSFQGVDRESYEEVRNGGSWDKLIENIQLMNRIRGGKEKPYIQISTTTSSEEERQIKNFREKMSGLCDYLNVGKTEFSHLDVEKMNLSEEKKKVYIELRERESLQKEHLEVCPEVYDKLSMNWNGTVTACCSDYDDMMLVGDFNRESIQDIYCGSRINKLREIISRKEYDSIPICKNCYQDVVILK